MDYHKQALVLSPLNSSTYSAIGYIYILMGKYKKAVDYFHKVVVESQLGWLIFSCPFFLGSRNEER